MNESESVTTTPSLARSSFADGATLGVGSLPHVDPAACAAFSIDEFDIATIPTMPRRSASETMLAQAVGAMPGVDIDPSGTIVADAGSPAVQAQRWIDGDEFGGLRAFLELAATTELDGAPVKWQFVGPVTLGIALHRAGLFGATAFDRALETVRERLAGISELISEALPNSEQMVMLDEPWFGELMHPGFPIPPDEAIDRMSSAMAAVPATTRTGVHCCAPCDVATLLASGPNVVSLPVSAELVDWVGYLTRFLADGGVIAWGVIPTDGPVPSTSERQWREMSDLWCSLVQLGCDPVRLRRQSLITPHCGLAMHTEPVAQQIVGLAAEVGKRVQGQSSATRFALGA